MRLRSLKVSLTFSLWLILSD